MPPINIEHFTSVCIFLSIDQLTCSFLSCSAQCDIPQLYLVLAVVYVFSKCRNVWLLLLRMKFCLLRIIHLSVIYTSGYDEL
jgi:hypothetical protein